jgi:hypothetical protein
MDCMILPNTNIGENWVDTWNIYYFLQVHVNLQLCYYIEVYF